MKHSFKITAILIIFFLIAQIVGILVNYQYSPIVVEKKDFRGELVNVSEYSLPYGTNPPEEIDPGISLISIIIAIAVAVGIMLILMNLKAEVFIRYWFLFVIIVAISISINSFIIGWKYSSGIALLFGIVLGFLKIFKRGVIIHNLTEILIYPGLSAIIVPLFNILSMVILLVAISLYDIYAVWHSGFMQKMAKYQMEKVGVFSGLFIPYIGKKEREKIKQIKNLKKNKAMKFNVAILGGGDIVFPMILAGVVLRVQGLLPAGIIALFSTLALTYLLYASKKGKFYPAMPYISVGCFLGLLVNYLIF